MPPRYSYWTILAGGLPTAFRAADRAELLPTFHRIRHTQPDAEMKWFARGRLWESPEADQADRARAQARRSRDWRPGGEHRDPRQKFKDAKRERNTAGRKRKFERKSAAPASPARFSSASASRPPRHARPRGTKPPGRRRP
jgi:hypothetical protein